MERYWCIRGGLGEGGMRNSRRVGMRGVGEGGGDVVGVVKVDLHDFGPAG